MSYQLQFQGVLKYADLLLQGTLTTMLISVAAIVAATVVGMTLAALRIAGNGAVARLIEAYVDIIRNTPFIVQLYFIFFGLPVAGIRLGLFEAALLSLVINLSGYTTEIIRAGLEVTPQGQVEAGSSLGLSRWQVYLYVMALPAIERVYPALCSQFVLAMLGTSIVSQISVEELTGVAALIQARTYRAFETYIVLAGIYILLTFLFRYALYALGYFLFPWRRRPSSER
jgi:polar amino acid transport system permease protein